MAKEEEKIVLETVKLSELNEYDSVPTGIVEIDEKIQIPVGQVVSIFGPEDSGKSTTAHYIMRSFQKHDSRDIAFVNFEQKRDLDYIRIIGVDFDRVDYYDHPILEDVADHLETYLERYSLIVIDSLAASTTKTETEGSHSDQNVGDKARVVNRMTRKLQGKLRKNKTSMLVINQVRDIISRYGGGWTTPGGHAVKHNAIIRGRQTRSKRDDLSIVSKLSIVKNQYNGWKGDIEFIIDSSRVFRGLPPISPMPGIVREAINKEIITQKGSWYSWTDTGETIAQGLDNTVEEIEKSEEFLDKLYKELDIEEIKNG